MERRRGNFRHPRPLCFQRAELPPGENIAGLMCHQQIITRRRSRSRRRPTSIVVYRRLGRLRAAAHVQRVAPRREVFISPGKLSGA